MKIIPFGKPEIQFPPLKWVYYYHNLTITISPSGAINHVLGPKDGKFDIELAPKEPLADLALGVKLYNLKAILKAKHHAKPVLKGNIVDKTDTIILKYLES